MQNVTTNKISFTPYQRLMLVLLGLLQFTIIFDFVILSPLGERVIKSLQITPGQFGIIVSSYAFSAGISGFLFAGYADFFDRKKALVVAYAGFITGTVLCSVADTYWLLISGRVLTGAFSGVVGALIMAVIADLFHMQQRGRVIGIVQMAFGASQALGIPFGLLLANAWGWQATFLFIVLFAVAIALVLHFKMKPIEARVRSGGSNNALVHFTRVISMRSYHNGFIAIGLLTIGGFMLMPLSSTFMVNNLGLSQAELPLIFLITGFSSFFIMPVVGRLSDQHNKFRLLLLGSIVAVVMVIVFTQLSAGSFVTVLLVNVFLFIGISMRMIPANALNTGVPSPADRGAYLSISSSLQQLAGGMGALMAGMVVSQQSPVSPLVHYDLLGFLGAGVILGCLPFFYRIQRSAQPKDSNLNVTQSKNNNLRVARPVS